MALAMPSRFAVLKIEDDDFKPQNPPKIKEKKKINEGKVNKKTDKPNDSSNKKATKKKDKKKNDTHEQWEQWKVKDSEFVEGNYEQDLQNALLLSKLDYEEKKVVNKQGKLKESEEKKDSGKKKKGKAMSLEQFNSMVSGNDTKANGNATQSQEPEIKSDTQFFERINAQAKEVISKEHRNEKINKTEAKKFQKQFNDETITIAQIQEKLDQQIAENASLRQELNKSKKEILAVKDRNKTLCGILAHGEMKDKADVLMELDRLSRVRDELTDEVTRLHGLLEQERSKVSTLTSADSSSHNNHSTHGKKEKNSKKRPSDNVQQ